jgi:AcrR family transcriptional regulator
LRAEIVDGATAILERTGSEEAITLRAIAREIGIAAPSISDHFTDRAAIIDAVVAQELTTLTTELTAAASAGTDAVDTLCNAWTAYVHFGRTHPGPYRVIFERRFLDLWEDDQREMVETLPVFMASAEMMIGLLQSCIDAGRSESTDAYADSVCIWYFVHGLVALPTSITSFAWPDFAHSLRSGLTTLGHLVPAGTETTTGAS